jgi:preprotein translocase subunit SecE
VNREMRRLQQKEEERAKRRRQEGPRPRSRDRVGVRQYFHEVRQELKKVAWPTRQETVTFTIVVLIVTAFVTGFTFSLDFVFKKSILDLLTSAV